MYDAERYGARLVVAVGDCAVNCGEFAGGYGVEGAVSVTSEEAAAIKRLRAENAELRRADEILKAASAFFAAELDRQSKRS